MFDDGREFDCPLTPLEVLQRWPAQTPVMLLHAGRYDPRWANTSILAASGNFDDAFRVTLDEHDRPVLHHHGGQHRNVDVFAALDALLAEDDALYLGAFSYDVARIIESLPRRAKRDGDWPVIQLQRCTGFATYDLATQQWRLHGRWINSPPPEIPPEVPPEVFSQTPSEISPQAAKAAQPISRFSPAFSHGPIAPDLSRSAVEAKVQRTIDYIAAGDIFQANIAQRFCFDFQGDPRRLSLQLARQAPAWYAAHLELPAADPAVRQVLASSSPELFLAVDANRTVTTRPMKGTRPASAPAQELADSEKDRAELNMIVDLMRNDLGRVCDIGSVRVAEPRTIETHPTVHQAVSTVTGRLPARCGLGELLRATLPGGSITGAPKVRAMQIIDELEPVRRGPYCGAIGWLRRGQMTLAMTIRTLLLESKITGETHSGRGSYSVGAGIVADSSPAGEYAEMLDKAAAIRRALDEAK